MQWLPESTGRAESLLWYAGPDVADRLTVLRVLDVIGDAWMGDDGALLGSHLVDSITVQFQATPWFPWGPPVLAIDDQWVGLSGLDPVSASSALAVEIRGSRERSTRWPGRRLPAGGIRVPGLYETEQVHPLRGFWDADFLQYLTADLQSTLARASQITDIHGQLWTWVIPFSRLELDGTKRWGLSPVESISLRPMIAQVRRRNLTLLP